MSLTLYVITHLYCVLGGYYIGKAIYMKVQK